MRSKIFSLVLSILAVLAAVTVVIKILPLSYITVLIVTAIVFIYGSLMTLSWRNMTNANSLQTHACEYTGGKGKIIGMALAIGSPFYFCQFLVAIIPIYHYTVWLLVFFPTVFLLSVPLALVADFCRAFGIRRRLFWTIQLTVQVSCLFLGRVVSEILRNFV